MPAAKPPPRKKPAPEPAEGAGFAGDRAEAEGRSIGEATDPGGPSPDVLAQARREKTEKQNSDEAPVQPAPGDATLVYDKKKGRGRVAAEDAPRLLVTAGPRKGIEHALVEELTTIGRGEGNVLVIPDISVSRQHSRLEKQAGR